MGQLEDMQIFARVIESGSITQAAEQLGIAKSAVSKRLAALEHKLGIKLINRTTRKSSITDAGRHYYQRSQHILDEVAELNSQTANETLAISGPLKLTVPVSFGIKYLSKPLSLFIQRHPEINLQVHFSDHHIDLVEAGFDLAIRIGQLRDSNLQAKKLKEIKQLLCANPKYLKQFPILSTPEQLKHHQLLKYDNNAFNTITMTDKQGNVFSGLPQVFTSANNGDFLCELAISGMGIIQIPYFFVWQHLKDNTLEQVLSDYQLPSYYAYAVYPQNRHLPRKVRVLIDFVEQQLNETPF